MHGVGKLLKQRSAEDNSEGSSTEWVTKEVLQWQKKGKAKRIEAKDRGWKIERAKHADVAHTGRGWCFAYTARRTKIRKSRTKEVWAPTAICADHTHRKRKTGKDQKPNLQKDRGEYTGPVAQNRKLKITLQDILGREVPG